MYRKLPVLLFFWSILQLTFSAPFYPQNFPYDRPTMYYGYDYVRQGPIGSWIMNNEFFPIEINVPDAINNASTNVQNFWMSVIQQFPFIHRVINGETPRPFKLIVLVPVSKDVSTQQMYNPFSEDYNKFPFYP